MVDAFVNMGGWVMFSAAPFLTGVGILLVPVCLIVQAIYRRRLTAWAGFAERVYPQVQLLGQSWALHAPPEAASALCYVTWLLYWQRICRENRVPKLRWEARSGEAWAEYEGRMLVRFALLQAILPPASRLRVPLKTLLNEMYLACSLGVEHCAVWQDFKAEKEIRQAAAGCSRDLRDWDKMGALFASATADHWSKKIDGLRDRLPEDSPSRTKSVEELAREFESEARWE